ncbi:MAG: hypothetical protein PVI06_10715 [Desulfobacterales bacterium]|jgi:hypothetical protein
MKKSLGAKPLAFITPIWVVGTYDQNGKPDIEKVKPIIFEPMTHTCHAAGKFLGKAFSIGKKI